MGVKKLPQGILGVVGTICFVLFFGVIAIIGSIKGCITDVAGDNPVVPQQGVADYGVPELPPPGARFGLDPIGQVIIRSREENLSQERRIRLMERQIAQLQRVVFNDPTIQAPVYSETVPDRIGEAPLIGANKEEE